MHESKRASRIPTAGRGADTAREQHAHRGAGRARGGTAAARGLRIIHFEDWNSRAPQSKRTFEPEARESSPAHSPRAGCELQSHLGANGRYIVTTKDPRTTPQCWAA